MADKLSERELEALFKKYMPSDEIPPGLADRVQQRVLAEVAVTLRKNQDQQQNGQQNRGWWGRLLDGIPRLQMGPSLALAGATVAVLLLLLQFGDEFAAQMRGLVQEPSTVGQPGSVAVSTADPELTAGEDETAPPPEEETALEPSSVVSPTLTSTLTTTTTTPEETADAATEEAASQETPADGEEPPSGTDEDDEADADQQATEDGDILPQAGMGSDGSPAPTTPAITVQDVLTREAQGTAEASPTQEATTDAATGKPRTTSTPVLNPTPTFALSDTDATATPAATARATATRPSADTGVMPTNTPQPTATPRATNTPSRTPTRDAAGIATSPAASATPSPTRTERAPAGSFPTPTRRATTTPEPTATATLVPLRTAEPTRTNTPRPSPTATDTPDVVIVRPTATRTPRPTATPTATATATATLSPTPSLTPTPTQTPVPAPVAVEDAFSVDEDASVTINVLENDQNIDLDSLSVNIISPPQHGTLAEQGPGVYVYTPNANYHGADIAIYRISAGGLIDSAVISFQVNPVNDAPTAANDTYTVQEDSTLSVSAANGVLANDSDPDGDSLTVTQSGALGINSDGSFTYSPAPNFNGQETFSYTVSDGNGGTATATVTINVTPGNDAPTAASDAYTVAEDSTLSVSAANGVLANDSDLDGDSLTAAVQSNVQHGQLTLSGDGSFTYSPAPNFNGQDSFTYTASDGTGGTATATVTINVTPVDDPPTTQNDAYSVNEDATLNVSAANGVLANDNDPDGGPLNVAIQTNVQHGTLTLNGDGSFTYSPTPNFSGQDGFTYTVNGSSATVTINVEPVNDIPIANEESYTLDEDTELTVDAANGVLANDTDADGDTLSASVQDNVQNGELSLGGDGSFTYKPNANFNGTDGFTYQVSDNKGGTATAKVSITVNPVNDPPTINSAAPQNATVAAGAPFNHAVQAADPADNQGLKISIQGNAGWLTLTDNGNGRATLSGTPNTAGTYQVVIAVQDAQGATVTQTFTVTVTAPPTAPPSSPAPPPESGGG
jgi:VCBS repeat-containing protein